MSWSPGRLLVEGEEVRLTPYGPKFRVERVHISGAVLKPLYATPKEVTIGDRTFMASSGGSSIVVSAHAFVYREPGRCDDAPARVCKNCQEPLLDGERETCCSEAPAHLEMTPAQIREERSIQRGEALMQDPRIEDDEVRS